MALENSNGEFVAYLDADALAKLEAPDGEVIETASLSVDAGRR